MTLRSESCSRIHLTLLALGAVLLGACGAPEEPASAPDDAAAATADATVVDASFLHGPARVLFVGNSFTHSNGGIDKGVQVLVQADPRRPAITADRFTIGGATLGTLYAQDALHELIRDGRYDVVVLQEDIPEIQEHSIEPFRTYARLVHQEITAAGAQPVFFMAWAYARLDWVSQEEIAEATRAIGDELDAPVAPVGVAFARSLVEHPETALFAVDREHPSSVGTYLASCVLYATLYRTSPEGLSYLPPFVVTEEQAAQAQRIAWLTVQDELGTR